MTEINRITIWGYEHKTMIDMEWRPLNNVEVLCNNLGVVAKYVHIGERIYTPVTCHTNYKHLFL